METAGSDPYSENSGVDDGGYGASYAEAHRREERRRHRDYYNDPRSHRRLEPATREDGGSATPSDSEGVRGGGGSADPASRREGKHSSRAAASSGQAERSERSRKERAGSRNQISHSLPHTGGSSNRSSGHNSGRRIRSISEGHSLSRTHSGSDSDSLGSASGDSPQEPIIELLERERRLVDTSCCAGSSLPLRPVVAHQQPSCSQAVARGEGAADPVHPPAAAGAVPAGRRSPRARRRHRQGETEGG